MRAEAMGSTGNRPAVFAPGFKAEPYWWDAAPRPVGPPEALPRRVEVAIVGSGFTGLSAALTLARAGRDTLIVDREAVGAGASTRNFGMLGRQFKHSLTGLIASLGLERAKALYHACDTAFAFVNELIARERIACHLTTTGRFVAADTKSRYEALERELAARAEHLGHGYLMVPKTRQATELGTAAFQGGALIPEHRLVHPGLFHDGLAERVRQAGGRLAAGTAVAAVRRTNGGWRIETSRGPVEAEHLVAATNGYTGKATPWLRRRIVPIDGYMIATEPVDADILATILPNGRGFHDSACDMVYGRLSPDGSRLLFGGLTGYAIADPRVAAHRLHARLATLFPALGGVRLSHAWTGRCGGTFDYYPHKGAHGGLHFAAGYCFGAGMPFGTWLGHQVAQDILGRPGTTPLDDLEMPTNPLYWGRPWFMPLYVSYQRWLDRRATRRG